MAPAVPRRRFLAACGGGALGAALVPSIAARSQTERKPKKPASATLQLIAELEARIPPLMAETGLPGLSMVLVRDRQPVWQRGFGTRDRESKAPVDTDTVFEAQSMSKPVFAYAVMKLCEKGVLQLHTPLTQYTPDRLFAGDPRLDLVTARHVLSHTTGLPGWRSQNTPLGLQFAPGERWHYSGEAYAYLQSVVTHLTGRVDRNTCRTYEADLRVCATDIGDYLAANVLTPFGMSSSGYLWRPLFEERAARRHDAGGAPLPVRRSSATDAARYASAGGLLTTPADYAKFLIEVIDPRPPDAFRLRADSLREMLRPAVKVSDDPRPTGWALGWQVLDTGRGTVVAHGGANPGTHSYAAASVERRSAFVVMTNGETGTEVLRRLVLGDAMPRILDV